MYRDQEKFVAEEEPMESEVEKFVNSTLLK